jgi:hypothetical protein
MPDSVPIRAKTATALLIGYGAMTLVIASRLEVGYFDGFAYLQAARALLDPSLPLPLDRPPLFTLLVLPIVAAARILGDEFLFRAPFVLAALLSTATVAAGYRYARRVSGRRRALTALCLIILNPVIVHYGPFPMHDMPAALLTIGALLAYVKERRAGGGVYVTGMLAGLAAAMRYPLAVLPAVFVLTEMLLARRGGVAARRNLRSGRYWLSAALLPFAVTSIVALIYLRIRVDSIAEAIALWTGALAGQASQPYQPETNPAWEYLAAFATNIAMPVWIVGIAGLLAAIRSRRPVETLAAVAILVLLGVQSALGPKESRYLMPVWILFPVFVVQGARWMGVGLRRVHVRGILRRAIVWALVIVSIPAALVEGRRFEDPAFTRPYWRNVIGRIRERVTPGAPILVAGLMSPVFPSAMPEGAHDEFRCVFHFGEPQLVAFSGHRIYSLPPSAGVPAVVVDSGAAVVRLAAHPINRANLPSRPPAIEIEWYDPVRDTVVHDSLVPPGEARRSGASSP